jgi:glycosyltransferase involved in cell wall biosynthesis
MNEIEWTPMSVENRTDVGYLAARMRAFNPDVVVLSGWSNPAYRKLPRQPEARGRRFVMCMDTPWRGTARQHLAAIALRSYLARIDDAVVTGERSWQYAIRLGFPERRIHRCLYGVDFGGLSSAYDDRSAKPAWPRQFLFAGRYVPAKGIDLLVAAYARYRERVSDPWPLVCCGRGRLAGLLAGQPGISDLGFQQPSDLHRLIIESGAFVLPSLFDPWPLAVVEASAAGLPVMCSQTCGSSVEVVRDGYSGFTFATGDVADLAKTLVRVHNAPDLREIGARARAYAAAYSADEWARKWLTALAEE